MSLTISNFKTRCRVPRRSQLTREFVDRVVRQGLTSELKRQLSLLPDSQPTVIRIRRLPLQLKVAATNLTEENLARAWAVEFLRTLSMVLSSARADKREVVQAETRTQWLANFISDLISGAAPTQWEYEEFADLFRLGTAEAAVTVLCREPSEILSVLLSLDAQGRLEPLLLLLDDFALDRLFVSIANRTVSLHSEPTIDDLLTIGALITSSSHVSGKLATRRRALRLSLSLSKLDELSLKSHWTPRLILILLRALDVLVEATNPFEPAMWVEQLSAESLTRGDHRGDPVALALVEQVRSLAFQAGGEIQERKLAALAQLLTELTPLSEGKPIERSKESYWLASDSAGLLLLVGLLNRFDWPQRILKTSLGLNYGPRAIGYCLAGMGLRLLGNGPETDHLDSGLFVFAGWVEPASADLKSFRGFLSSSADAERQELLLALDLGEEIDNKTSRDWDTTFDLLASWMTKEFAARVRGFRKASAPFVVKSFFRQPGRICIDEKRILVILQHNPFHIALHLSGFDQPVESVSWLGGRRLEFQLEDL